MFNPEQEVPLDSLNLSDLIMQFKLMKAMGYKSLFDPEFRREMKNPFRKHLYYKILIAEESTDRKILYDYINSVSDKLAFFSDPSLYRKMKEQEKKDVLDNPDLYAKQAREIEEKYSGALAAHAPPKPEEQKAVAELLNRIKPRRSMVR